jgi:excisionase family DNA binding protein
MTNSTMLSGIPRGLAAKGVFIMSVATAATKPAKSKITSKGNLASAFRPTLELAAHYSVKQAAAVVNCAEITIWRAISSANLQTHRTGRKRLISGAQLKNWLDAGGKTGATGGSDHAK